ncbi:retrovirus-related Pol polyprotein from transposon 297 [Trichonephila clavipes]|nr:retrovirus-related Pol polyprotein from transposon 297 [Trichonephila clavipes]
MNHKVLPYVRRISFPAKINKQISTETEDKAKEARRKSFGGHSQIERRTPLSCYGWRKPSYIKSKCPDCNPSKDESSQEGAVEERASLSATARHHSRMGFSVHISCYFDSKTNGSMRLYIDCWKLNAQTIPDSYPLPRMYDLLNEARQTAYVSTIDLRSGYHQVKVVAEDQDKTAFTYPFGIYKFPRMLFGLRNAPATFQRLIDNFHSGLNNVLALSYLDIIILSPNFQKYLSDLQ